MIWFTSDTHFNHTDIIKFSKRPFKSLEDMHKSLISNWNSKVKKGDTIYHLGDFCLSWGKINKDLINNLLSQLNGNKWLIIGNHDRKEVVKNIQWNKVIHYHEIKHRFLESDEKQKIIMCHYSLRVWNQMHKGSWMLFGHSHGNLHTPEGLTMDVGVDSNNYTPLSIIDVKKFMDNRTITTHDHHKPNNNFIFDRL